MGIMLWFVIKEGNEYYVEPHRSPAKAEEIEVDGKQIISYKFSEKEAEAIATRLGAEAV